MADTIQRCLGVNVPKPVYEEHVGWTEDVSKVRALEDLPAAARAYIVRLEELIGVPVGIVSVGPGRDATITLRPAF